MYFLHSYILIIEYNEANVDKNDAPTTATKTAFLESHVEYGQDEKMK